MSKTTRRKVKLSDIRAQECNGRGHQSPDPKYVLYLVSLLEAGISFRDPLLLTADFVLVGGHHRLEAYITYYTNLYKTDADAFAAVTIDVEVLPQNWDNSTEQERAELRIRATVDENRHTSGRAYTPFDIRILVGQLLNGAAKLSQRAIKTRLVADGVPEVWVVRAFRDLADSENQRKLSLARTFKKDGYSVKEALVKAGLPTDTDLSTKPFRDPIRQNKIKKSIETIVRNWDTLAKEHHERYEAGSITQQQYHNLCRVMSNEVTRLQRKVDSITKQVNDHLRISAGLIRTVGASEKTPTATF